MSDKQATPKPDRPTTRNYGITADESGLMDWDWVDEQMAQSRNYWICSTRPDGRPHATPVWGVWVDGVLYFGNDRQSRKARNLAHSPEVVVHLESGDDTVILEGTVEAITDKALLAQIAEVYALKYPPYKPDPEPGPDTLYYKLVPRTGFSWLERDFPNTATRWQFDA